MQNVWLGRGWIPLGVMAVPAGWQAGPAGSRKAPVQLRLVHRADASLNAARADEASLREGKDVALPPCSARAARGEARRAA